MNLQHKIAVWIAGHLETKQNESKENTLLFIYGIEVFLNEFYKLITAWGIGLLVGKLKEVVFATFFLLLMRNIAGGIHFKSNFICFITSVMAIVLPSVIGSFFILPMEYFFIIFSIECITLFIVSPYFKNNSLRGIQKWVRKSVIVYIYIIGTLWFLYGQNWTYINMIFIITAIEIVSLLGKRDDSRKSF
ncbi:MAG: hypothetical protein HDR01_14510 [Lachnospiraceae bacterium]|nr:hypothetical protein [Lachnospiraceae bacterium]